MHIFKNTHYDFLKWRWHAIALSWLLIIAGGVFYLRQGIPLGVEFAGGTAIVIKFEQPTSVEGVRRALDAGAPGRGENAIITAYGDASLNQVMIRVPQVGAEAGTSLTQVATSIENALKQGGL